VGGSGGRLRSATVDMVTVETFWAFSLVVLCNCVTVECRVVELEDRAFDSDTVAFAE
jgi:hypothetical protein